MPVHKTLLGIGSAIGGALPGVGTAFSAFQTARNLIVPGSSSRTASNKAQKRLGAELKLGGGGAAESRLKFTTATVGGGGSSFVPIPFTLPSLPGVIDNLIDDDVNGNGCQPPLIRNPKTGNCIAPTSPRGAELFAQQAIAGQYGAGFIPGTKLVDVATCGRKQVLGSDGICYNKGQISNSQRMWPKGRKPLLTGGDMNAITTANRAARRVEATTKRLQSMGMMKKPAPRRAVPRGHTAKLSH